MVLVSVILVVSVVVFYCISSTLRRRRPVNSKKYCLPPGPRGIPFVGNSLAVRGHPRLTYTAWQEDHGEIFMVKFGPVRVVVLGSAKMIRQCFQNPNFNGRPSEWSAKLLTQGRYGLLTTEGDEWEEQSKFTGRHLRSFGFNSTAVEGYIIFQIEQLTDWMKSESDLGNSIYMKDRLELAVSSVLWTIVAGKRFQPNDAQKIELFRNLHRTFGSPTVCSALLIIAPALCKLFPRFTGYKYARDLSDELYAMLQTEIDEHVDTLPKTGIPRDFIDAYLMEIRDTSDPKSTFYQEEGIKSLKATIGEFFFGATETMSLTLSWAMLYLSLHQDVQQKLRDQIDLHVPPGRPVLFMDKADLPFGEAVVLEVLRKSSIVVTGVMHRAMKDDNFMGYDIPRKTWIMSNMYAIHHSKKVWGDPENFRPERFLLVDGSKCFKSINNLVAFSLGRRSCMGEALAKDECFLFICNIVRQFRIHPDHGFKPVTEEPQKGFLLKPYDFKVFAVKR